MRVRTRCALGPYLRSPIGVLLDVVSLVAILLVILAGVGYSHGNVGDVYGFLCWAVFNMVAMSGAGAVLSEAAAGTLEKTLSGPLPHLTIVLGDIVGDALVGTIRLGVLVLAVVPFALGARVLRPDVPLIVLLLLLFCVGTAVGLAGVAIVWRRLAGFQNVFYLGMLGVGFLAANSNAAALRFFPYAASVRLLARPAIAGAADLAALALGTAAWCAAMLLLFAFCDRRALRAGSLSRY